jgi:serine O-acetyltransferase
VIGETAVLGDHITLYQGVTLGGTGKETGKRHPTLEDNIMVSAGAKVIGSLTIGKHSKIGAGAVVLRDVPPNSTVVGIPGRVVKQNGSQIPQLQQLFNSPPEKAGGKTDLYQVQHSDYQAAYQSGGKENIA